MDGVRLIKINREDFPRNIRRRWRLRRWAFFGIFILLASGSLFYGVNKIKANAEYIIELPAGLDRTGISKKIGEELGWSERETRNFAGTYAEMHWMAYSADILKIFVQRFKWGEEEKEIFLTNAARYKDPEFDFLSGSYKPATYTVKGDMSMANIAALLIDGSDFNEKSLKEDMVLKVSEFVERELDLLPDLVPLPAKDMVVERVEEDVLLRFSTIYYNQGTGPLELRADTATKGIRSDIERNVFQRIYKRDGTHRDKISGTFLWHQQHLHYHFADFVIYDLEVVDAKNAPDLSGVRSKSTFCIRDVSRVNMELANRDEQARYLICGKELQGISVGWGDTYFYNYVDQNLNITDLPSGIYKLSFIANPDNKFEESRTDNNKSSVTIQLNMEKLTVKVLKEEPEGLLEVEHIYEEQVFD